VPEAFEDGIPLPEGQDGDAQRFARFLRVERHRVQRAGEQPDARESPRTTAERIE
jgi:hypothetical protein